MKNMQSLLAQGKQIWKNAGKYKFILFALLAGILILLLTTSDGIKETPQQSTMEGEEDFSVEALETRLEETLSQISGAGQVVVMLTVESGMQRVYAQNESMERGEDTLQQEEEYVVISNGSNQEDTVLIQQIYPKFQGALVVATGGGNPEVRLKLTEALSALTGLGTDKISICEGK